MEKEAETEKNTTREGIVKRQSVTSEEKKIWRHERQNHEEANREEETRKTTKEGIDPAGKGTRD